MSRWVGYFCIQGFLRASTAPPFKTGMQLYSRPTLNCGDLHFNITEYCFLPWLTSLRSEAALLTLHSKMIEVTTRSFPNHFEEELRDARRTQQGFVRLRFRYFVRSLSSTESQIGSRCHMVSFSNT